MVVCSLEAVLSHIQVIPVLRSRLLHAGRVLRLPSLTSAQLHHLSSQASAVTSVSLQTLLKAGLTDVHVGVAFFTLCEADLVWRPVRWHSCICPSLPCHFWNPFCLLILRNNNWHAVSFFFPSLFSPPLLFPCSPLLSSSLPLPFSSFPSPLSFASLPSLPFLYLFFF